ncbi:MAG: tryptophan synthase subunit alpha [Alphaproteobacteria bacterium]|nr:tryptophan synthase subunit alpha [Alphaproteobacteria bacterium]|tara:strand:- start:101 stop:895 length:795 start_codon:yes stop_codon:yes gene_type:complete
MSNRIAKCFDALKQKRRSGLIPFIMGGDPNYQISLDLLKALPDAGADLIEIGIPFADPMADGPVIQEAGERALKSGMTLEGVLDMVGEFRAGNNDTPVIVMGYANPVYHYGLTKFCKRAKEVGIDGMIIVDLPPEESEDLHVEARKYGLDIIRLVTTTSSDERADIILQGAGGFLYYVAVAGITGTKSASSAQLKHHFERLREKTALPLAVGFGIKTPDHVKDMAQIADAVVVGSAIVKTIGQTDTKNVINKVVRQVKDLANAL